MANAGDLACNIIMALRARLRAFLTAHSKAIRATIQLTLLLAILASYVLYIILFLKPQWFHISSLTRPDKEGLKPTTAVTLISTVFAAATSALITTCVEQSLWFKLAPRTLKRPLTVKETHHLAQWAVSPLGRLTYALSGSSWPLKLAGPLLVATAIVSPVLVSGISVSSGTTSSSSTSQAVLETWDGYLDAANFQYNGGDFSDVPHEVAALAYLSNLAVPSSNLCTSPGCSLTARAGSMHAQCKTTSAPHAVMYGGEQSNETYTSAYNPDINVILVRGSPYTYVNFTSWFAKDCDVNQCPGVFAVIFGAFVNETEMVNSTEYVNTVDCLITYGVATIRQTGSGTPTIEPGSYQQNMSSVYVPLGLSPIKRIYTDSYYRSPYYFTAMTGTGDTADSLYNSAVGTLLLTPRANSSAEQVGQRIESIFETATLMAFVRSPGAANVTVTHETTDPVYAFHPLVLLILLVPAFATVLGTSGRCRVVGSDICPGYDPVEIARRGPVTGLQSWDGGAQDGEQIREKHVTTLVETRVYPENGLGERRYRLVVA